MYYEHLLIEEASDRDPSIIPTSSTTLDPQLSSELHDPVNGMKADAAIGCIADSRSGQEGYSSAPRLGNRESRACESSC
jgi:hypothetical protein